MVLLQHDIGLEMPDKSQVRTKSFFPFLSVAAMFFRKGALYLYGGTMLIVWEMFSRKGRVVGSCSWLCPNNKPLE